MPAGSLSQAREENAYRVDALLRRRELPVLAVGDLEMMPGPHHFQGRGPSVENEEENDVEDIPLNQLQLPVYIDAEADDRG